MCGAARPSVEGMSDWRPDVADAVGRMRVTFGARTAARNLPDCLDPGEQVRELVACTYAGGDGLLVLTDRRVIAVRDDYARYRVQALDLADAYAVDYAPRVHDGIGVLTPTGRIAVRKMHREDSDRLVTALVTAHPHVVVGASRPRPTGPVPPPAEATPPTPEPGAEHRTTNTESAAPAHDDASALGTPETATRAPVPADAVVDAATTESDVLLGVLADLHAQGILTADELAAKIAQVTTRA